MHSAMETSIACALSTWTLQICDFVVHNIRLGVNRCLCTYFEVLTKQVSNRGLPEHKVTLGYFLIYLL
jgi:hypothetical protein